eukprot:1509764-Karenia_brevis.AAC.1
MDLKCSEVLHITHLALSAKKILEHSAFRMEKKGRNDKDDDDDENAPSSEIKFSWDMDSVNAALCHRRKMHEGDTNITQQ